MLCMTSNRLKSLPAIFRPRQRASTYNDVPCESRRSAGDDAIEIPRESLCFLDRLPAVGRTTREVGMCARFLIEALDDRLSCECGNVRRTITPVQLRRQIVAGP